MIVTTLAAPAAEPVSLAEAKEYLRIGGDGEDGLVGSLIAGARQPGARRLGGDRREPGHPRMRGRGAACHRARMPMRDAPVSRSSVTVRLQGHRPGTGPQPSSVTAAPRLGA